MGKANARFIHKFKYFFNQHIIILMNVRNNS